MTNPEVEGLVAGAPHMKTDTRMPPCPFCGGAAVYCFNATAARAPMHWYLCRDCHASPGDRPTEAEAVAAWNRRATPTPPVDGEAKIREVLEQLRGEFAIERAIGQRQIEQLEAALQRLLWAATERDRRNRIREFDQIIDEAREALASTQTGGGE